MLKSILVPVSGETGGASSALETAYAAAEIFQAHIDCVFVRRDPVRIVAGTGSFGADLAVVSPEIWSILDAEEKTRREAAQTRFRSFCSAHGIEIASSPAKRDAVTACWHEAGGEFSDQVVLHGRFHDLIVLDREDESAASRIGDILMASGRPVILAPPRPPSVLNDVVAIAWKDTAEAARALTASMPLLISAKKVAIISADEGDGQAERSADALLRALAWHNIAATVTCLPETSHLSNDIQDAAAQAGATLLVMGGYSRSRAREFVFGGLTRDIVYGADISVLLCH